MLGKTMLKKVFFSEKVKIEIFLNEFFFAVSGSEKTGKKEWS